MLQYYTNKDNVMLKLVMHQRGITILLIIFVYKLPALFDEVVVSESEKVNQGCGAHTSLRRGGNKVLHFSSLIINSRDVVFLLEGEST